MKSCQSVKLEVTGRKLERKMYNQKKNKGTIFRQMHFWLLQVTLLACFLCLLFHVSLTCISGIYCYYDFF